MKSRSYNVRLILVILAVIALCWTVVLAVVLSQLSLNRSSSWDEKLAGVASQLIVTIPADSRFEGRAGPGLTLREFPGAKREPLAFQVWIDRNRLVASTPRAPNTPLHPEFSDGPASTFVEGNKWRVYSASDTSGRVNVQVGSLQSVVDADMRHEAAHALVLATVLLMIAGFIMWLVSQSTLKPIRALGAAMRQRRAFDFTTLPLDRLPRELHPLVDSFNHVLGQLHNAIEGERRFIGDAAHELRTPLSALQAQAEIALRATDPQEKEIALKKLLVVAQRSTRLSEQLLDLARIHAGAKAPKRAPADLGKLVQYVAQEFEVYASQNKRSLFLDIHACTIQCDIDEIGILLRNLMHNAMRYTAEGGNVLVRCGYQASDNGAPSRSIYLEVADNGPGVPDEEHEAIFERFHRAAGTPVRGSGIGLSLVAGIAESHEAIIETGTGLEGRGLMVRVVFPAAAASSCLT